MLPSACIYRQFLINCDWPRRRRLQKRSVDSANRFRLSRPRLSFPRYWTEGCGQKGYMVPPLMTSEAMMEFRAINDDHLWRAIDALWIPPKSSLSNQDLGQTCLLARSALLLSRAAAVRANPRTPRNDCSTFPRTASDRRGLGKRAK
jgi:hypothetical protein